MTSFHGFFLVAGTVNVTLSDYPTLDALDLNPLTDAEAKGGVESAPSDVEPADGFASNGGRGGVLPPSMIVLLVVSLATLLVVASLLLVKWQRRRFRRRGGCGSWNGGVSSVGVGRPAPPQQVSVLTFANPNYTPSSSAPDVVTSDAKKV